MHWFQRARLYAYLVYLKARLTLAGYAAWWSAPVSRSRALTPARARAVITRAIWFESPTSGVHKNIRLERIDSASVYLDHLEGPDERVELRITGLRGAKYRLLLRPNTAPADADAAFEACSHPPSVLSFNRSIRSATLRFRRGDSFDLTRRAVKYAGPSYAFFDAVTPTDLLPFDYDWDETDEEWDLEVCYGPLGRRAMFGKTDPIQLV